MEELDNLKTQKKNLTNLYYSHTKNLAYSKQEILEKRIVNLQEINSCLNRHPDLLVKEVINFSTNNIQIIRLKKELEELNKEDIVK